MFLPRKPLAVDDDALVLLNTAAMLEDLGHTVAEAHSAAAALRLLEEQPFDLVITDHAMPKMTGLQLSNTIKVQWPNVPVIIATGYAELPGTRDIKILSKPFTEKELASAITSVRFIWAAGPANVPSSQTKYRRSRLLDSGLTATISRLWRSGLARSPSRRVDPFTWGLPPAAQPCIMRANSLPTAELHYDANLHRVRPTRSPSPRGGAMERLPPDKHAVADPPTGAQRP
ncbi:response regulator [Mesorhizobium ciceri]|uniref:response regulator n=1 Tax=Mesorhizobium ciceri TaxID=39645 RepID=UPI00344DFE73